MASTATGLFQIRSWWRRAPAVAVAVMMLGVVLSPAAALAAGRVALVVGNGTYGHIGRLPNPGNDAADMGAALRRLGFDVTTVRDANRVAMTEALRVFTRASAGADVSLVFYAGHGLEMDGVNYLVPVDARLERDTDVRFEAVELDDVLASTVGAGLRVVILDACRNNPLARSMQRTGASRSVSRGSFGGLDESLLGDETLVAYAAAAGTTADDGEGRNSPYTSALLSHLEQPLEIGLLFREVRARVLEATGGRQRPHEYASLLGEHYLRAAVGTDPRAVETALGLDRAARRLVQEGLARAGFSPGPADGVFGPASRAAIRGWQASRGTTATGYLDAAGAAALGAPVPAPALDAVAASAATVSEPAAALARAETVFWESMRDSTSGSDFEAYLARWPTGIYAPLATSRLAALRAAAAPAGVDPPRAREPGEVFQDCPTCPELVVIPAGTFLMGSDQRDDESSDNERPRHRVTVDRFALGVHEVTRDEYQAFVAATGRDAGDRCYAFDADDERFDWREEASWRSPGFSQAGDHPVVCVNWEDAQAYVRWLSSETGEAYRLPSESEWEYAARAGTTTRRYWGDDPDDGCAYANGADRTAKRRFDGWLIADCTDGVLWTSPVGAYEPNAFGLQDMLGNVWEWVEDCWHDDYDDAPRDGSAWTRGGDCGRRRLAKDVGGCSPAAMTTSRERHRWARMRRARSGSTTCWGTSRNGWRTAGIRTTVMRQRTARRGCKVRTVVGVCSAAGLGAQVHRPYGQPNAPGAMLHGGPHSADFVWRGRSIDGVLGVREPSTCGRSHPHEFEETQ